MIIVGPGDEMALEAQGYRVAMAGEILGEKGLHVEIFIVAIESQGTSAPPKFNIDPEKWWLEDYFPFEQVTFQGLC